MPCRDPHREPAAGAQQDGNGQCQRVDELTEWALLILSLENRAQPGDELVHHRHGEESEQAEAYGIEQPLT